MEGNHGKLILGAIAGAALVAIPAAVLGALVRELAHPAVLVPFILLGAVLGAFAWGAVALEREREEFELTPAYRKGVLAERPAEPGEAEAGTAAGGTGLVWLLRHRTQSFLKLPLTPWI